jgi:hypothetical protein
MVRGVMLQKAVRLQVTMNNDVNVSLLLSLVHMLRRADGEQPQRGA